MVVARSNSSCMEVESKSYPCNHRLSLLALYSEASITFLFYAAADAFKFCKPYLNHTVRVCFFLLYDRFYRVFELVVFHVTGDCQRAACFASFVACCNFKRSNVIVPNYRTMIRPLFFSDSLRSETSIKPESKAHYCQ